MKDYNWTEDMREISGFGGIYENNCRKIISESLKWIDENNKKISIANYQQIYGVSRLDSNAQELEVYLASLGLNYTGAMLQACFNHIMLIQEIGWEEYKKQSRERKKNEH